MGDTTTLQPSEHDQPERTKRRWPRKLLLGIVIGFVVVATISALAFRVQVRRPFPVTDGTVTVPGLTSDVEVIRDSMGVPHIYADNVADLFMAQGYVHAQDRFFQMDFWRHISEGRLAEMFGSAQLETDRFLRTMGWGSTALAEYEADTPGNRAVADAYAAGVNAYLDERSPAELAFEYTVLEALNRSYDPEPWSPHHTLAWGKVMAWDLGGNMENEITRAIASAYVSPGIVEELFPPYPDRHPYILPPNSPAEGGVQASASASSGIPPAATALFEETLTAVKAVNDLTGGSESDAVGSNSWAVSGKHTPTGAPILANDPHLGIRMPSIWYQVGLHCREVTDACPYDVAGFSFAGMPGVIIGHNAHFAWGFTNVGPDVQDVYIEKINPNDPNQYEYMGEWLDMEVTTETLEVAGGESEELTIRTTIHGPIISGVYGPLDDIDPEAVDFPDEYALSFRWTGLDASRSLIAPILAVNSATNFEEFRAGALLFDVPSQNMLYADVDGNIGYQAPGLIPIRAQGDGRMPVPGWTGEFEWTGFIPEDDLPWVYNPESGWIVTANNAVIDESYPYLLTHDWTYGYRAQRAVDLLTSNLSMGIEGHQTMQMDGYDLNAEFALPYVLEALRGADLDVNDAERKAQNELAAWDLQNSADSTGAAVWNGVWTHMMARTLHDELPEAIWPPGGSTLFEAFRNWLGDPHHPLWDDVTTSQVIEDRDAILVAAFVDAVVELTDLMGSNVDDWSWGRIHTATFKNESLGESGIGLIEDRFNRGPYPASGSKSVLNAVAWEPEDEGYEVNWLPSMRMVVDLGDLTNSVAVHTTGQSGHTDHPHYDDMIPIWLAGDNVPMLWDRTDIEADAEATLILTP